MAPVPLASKSATAPLVVRVNFPDVETFIDRYAANVASGGMFIQTRTPSPPGTKLTVHVVLGNGTSLIQAEAKVIWAEAFDPSQPERIHGMGVRFAKLDDASKETVDAIIFRKSAVNPRLLKRRLRSKTQEINLLLSEATLLAEAEEPIHDKGSEDVSFEGKTPDAVLPVTGSMTAETLIAQLDQLTRDAALTETAILQAYSWALSTPLAKTGIGDLDSLATRSSASAAFGERLLTNLSTRSGSAPVRLAIDPSSRRARATDQVVAVDVRLEPASVEEALLATVDDQIFVSGLPSAPVDVADDGGGANGEQGPRAASVLSVSTPDPVLTDDEGEPDSTTRIRHEHASDQDLTDDAFTEQQDHAEDTHTAADGLMAPPSAAMLPDDIPRDAAWTDAPIRESGFADDQPTAVRAATSAVLTPFSSATPDEPLVVPLAEVSDTRDLSSETEVPLEESRNGLEPLAMGAADDQAPSDDDLFDVALDEGTATESTDVREATESTGTTAVGRPIARPRRNASADDIALPPAVLDRLDQEPPSPLELLLHAAPAATADPVEPASLEELANVTFAEDDAPEISAPLPDARPPRQRKSGFFRRILGRDKP